MAHIHATKSSGTVPRLSSERTGFGKYLDSAETNELVYRVQGTVNSVTEFLRHIIRLQNSIDQRELSSYTDFLSTNKSRQQEIRLMIPSATGRSVVGQAGRR